MLFVSQRRPFWSCCSPLREGNISESGSSFAKVLRSYQSGGLAYSDFLEYVSRQLAAGESPAELREIMQRLHLIEPLPHYAHDAVARLLGYPAQTAVERSDPQPRNGHPAAAPPESATSLRIDPDTTVAIVRKPAIGPFGPPEQLQSTATPPPATGFEPDAQSIDNIDDAGPSESGSSFAKVLRSYQSGGLAYSDFLENVSRQLAAGASPVELREIMRRLHLIEPLPHYAHDAVVRLLSNPAQTAAERSDPQPRNEHPAEPPPESATSLRINPDTTVAIAREPAIGPFGPPEQPQSTATPPPATGFEPDAQSIDDPDEQPQTIEFPKLRWVVRQRSPWKRRALWLFATLVVVIGAWIYGQPLLTMFAASSALQPAPPAATTSEPADAPAASRPAAAASPAASPPAPSPTIATSGVPGTTFRDCQSCAQLTVLPPGRFKQGSPFDDPAALPPERPQHIVRLREPFAMMTTELTVAEFGEFAAATDREFKGCKVYDGEWHASPNASWKNPGFTQGADHPVTCVSWNDAVLYAAWLSKKTGHNYRLPSASEWEYAARAGVDAAVPWTAVAAACATANVADKSAARRYPKWTVFACKDGYVNTAPVGSFAANAFGLKDMLGNVSVWTADCWHEDYVKAPIDGFARMDGDCSGHEARGASWYSPPDFVRLAYRNHFAADYRSSSVGVRLVRELTP